MTILRTNKYSINLPSIVEDPTPGANLIFFQNESFNSSTLDYGFNKSLSYNVAGTGYSTFGYSNINSQDSWGGVMFLNGEVTHVKHVIFNTNNDYRNNLDLSPFSSMDPSRPIKNCRYDTNGTNNSVLLTYRMQSSTAGNNYNNYFRRVNRSTDLSTSYPDQNTSFGTSYTFLPVYRNTVTNNLVCIGDYNASGYFPGAYAGFNLPGIFSNSAPSPASVTAVANRTNQFVGVGVSSQAIMMHNSVGNDFSQTFYRYNDSANTVVNLNDYSSAPSVQGTGGIGVYAISNRHETGTGSITVTGSGVGAASVTGYIFGKVLNVTAVTSGAIVVGQTIAGTGITANTTITALGTGTTTSVGGDRTTSYGGYQPKYASRTFADLSTSTVTQGFYVPYFDTAGKFQPFYYQWNTVTDNFVRNQDVMVTYTTGTLATYWAADSASATSVNVTYGAQRAVINETFTYNGGRYLTLMQLHGAGGIYDANASQRTMVTYTVDTSTYKTLAYHSSVAIPSTPKNIVWLNDNRTLLGVFAYSAFYIYNFTSAAGWTLINTQPYQFNAVGRDSLGRIWGQDTGPLGGGRIHILLSDTTSMPATISVVPAAPMFNYTGTNQLTSLAVDAYNSYSTRIALNVTLTVVGTSLRILDGAGTQCTTYTTATSTSTSTIVQAMIVGPGSSSLRATIAL